MMNILRLQLRVGVSMVRVEDEYITRTYAYIDIQVIYRQTQSGKLTLQTSKTTKATVKVTGIRVRRCTEARVDG